MARTASRSGVRAAAVETMLAVGAVRGAQAAESYILFRPELCKHYRGHPNEESTNETFAYDWPCARRCVLRRAGERRGAHGDSEEHQGNRRDHPWLSRLVDSVFLSGRQPEADRLCDGYLLQNRRCREEGAQA